MTFGGTPGCPASDVLQEWGCSSAPVDSQLYVAQAPLPHPCPGTALPFPFPAGCWSGQVAVKTGRVDPPNKRGGVLRTDSQDKHCRSGGVGKRAQAAQGQAGGDQPLLQALLGWVNRVCAPHDVAVRNFTAAFADGRAFFPGGSPAPKPMPSLAFFFLYPFSTISH